MITLVGTPLRTDIRRSHVNAWVAELAATRGAVTVRRALATLQMILSAAVREEIIPANPARNIDKPVLPPRVGRGGRGRLSISQTAQLVALYQAGLSQKDIAARLDRSPSTIWHCLRRAGLVGRKTRAMRRTSSHFSPAGTRSLP
jgi:DNA-binding NarL/FixJ family response regulator